MPGANDVAVAYVRAQLAACRAVIESGQTISGRTARGLVLPPVDEDPDVAARIAMYLRWLTRHAPPEAHDARS